jgi:SAM-dependent methyltransferase
MQTELTAAEWQDSQRHEAGFWSRQVADGNQEQRRRDNWYRGICFPDFFIACDLTGQALVDLGSGPAGILTTMPEARTRVQVDPLFPEFYADGYAPLPGIRNWIAPAEATGLVGNAYDVAFCMNMLDHTQRPRDVLAEAYRLLKSGGVLVLCVDLRPEGTTDRFHKLRLTRDQLDAWLAEIGYTTVDRRLVPHQAGNPAVQYCAVAQH